MREDMVSSEVSKLESEGSVIRNAGARALDVRDNNARQYQTMNDEHRQKLSARLSERARSRKTYSLVYVAAD